MKFIKRLSSMIKRDGDTHRHTQEVVSLEDSILRKPMGEWVEYVNNTLPSLPRIEQLIKMRVILDRIESLFVSIKKGKASQKYFHEKEEIADQLLELIFENLYLEKSQEPLFDEREVHRILQDIDGRLSNPNLHDKLVDWDVSKDSLVAESPMVRYKFIYDLLAKITPLVGENESTRDALLKKLNRTQLLHVYRIFTEFEIQLDEIEPDQGHKSLTTVRRILHLLEKWARDQSIDLKGRLKEYNQGQM